MIYRIYSDNNSLKPTVTRVTHFAEIAKFAPHYGGLVPPFCDLIKRKEIVKRWVYIEVVPMRG